MRYNERPRELNSFDLELNLEYLEEISPKTFSSSAVSVVSSLFLIFHDTVCCVYLRLILIRWLISDKKIKFKGMNYGASKLHQWNQHSILTSKTLLLCEIAVKFKLPFRTYIYIWPFSILHYEIYTITFLLNILPYGCMWHLSLYYYLLFPISFCKSPTFKIREQGRYGHSCNVVFLDFLKEVHHCDGECWMVMIFYISNMIVVKD